MIKLEVTKRLIMGIIAGVVLLQGIANAKDLIHNGIDYSNTTRRECYRHGDVSVYEQYGGQMNGENLKGKSMLFVRSNLEKNYPPSVASAHYDCSTDGTPSSLNLPMYRLVVNGNEVKGPMLTDNDIDILYSNSRHIADAVEHFPEVVGKKSYLRESTPGNNFNRLDN